MVYHQFEIILHVQVSEVGKTRQEVIVEIGDKMIRYLIGFYDFLNPKKLLHRVGIS